MRRVMDSLMPPGAIWRPRIGGYMDRLHDGLAAAMQVVHDYLARIGSVRNPLQTPVLGDLEREFGVSPSDGISDSTRRATLASKMFTRGLRGQYWVLQNALTQAGFIGVTVIPNDPAVNPAPFITGNAQMCCGGSNAYAGYYLGAAPPSGPYNAYAALYGGLLIVNGAQFVNTPQIVGAGSGLVSCHTIWLNTLNTNICGSFSYSRSQTLNYGSPGEPYKWPFVFFIAASATYDGSGHVLTLTQCTIPSARMSEFMSLVLHYKPIHAWAALIYTN
jgi:hypothetical protein